MLELLEGFFGFVLVLVLECSQSVQLGFLLVLGGSGEFDGVTDVIVSLAHEGVDSDDGELAGVFEGLVVDGFFLDFPSLVAGFHGSEDSASFGDRVEFAQDRFFHEVGEVVDDEGSLVWVFVFGQSPFSVDDELDCEGSPD